MTENLAHPERNVDAVTAIRAQITRIRGVVQGVGFRPFVFRLAEAHHVTGWVRNDQAGVCVHAEGSDDSLVRFTTELRERAPEAARIDAFHTTDASPSGFQSFQIVASAADESASALISPDLAACEDCVQELFDRANRRAGYPYINCTACGPRYSIMLGLPYDRPVTTMKRWTMCADCAREYEDSSDRRFHAQPVACACCGPNYGLRAGTEVTALGPHAIRDAAALLANGSILAIKGIGGYHLACDAANASAVTALRERKFRKERPFALMVRDLDTARRTVELDPAGEALLVAAARPILIAPALVEIAGVAPDTRELGIMLPYTPLHHLLFEHGAPERLVMTSGNRASEPIAFRDEEAIGQLDGIADAYLAGERPIARRMDDSVVRSGVAGPMVLRRSRGYAPGVVARLPTSRPILAVGADLKNAITLVVNGNAMMSQHIGDLENYGALEAFRETVADLLALYSMNTAELRIAHDLHPDYSTTAFALDSICAETRAVQHHRAHIASVLAEHGDLEERVIGVAFDGTGYGDDGGIWGGEFFVGSVTDGLDRVGHLRTAMLPGGDAAALHPVQSAAGFLADPAFDDVSDMAAFPFCFPDRYRQARELVTRGVRCFPTTSAGRLFDAVAAFLGFTRAITYEGQAAMWLEQLAHRGHAAAGYPCPFIDHELDFRQIVAAVIGARTRGDSPSDIARAFHRGFASGIASAVVVLAEEHSAATAVLSGGVFQNELLMADVLESLSQTSISVLTNRHVPPNDGGISLGQAALAVFAA